MDITSKKTAILASVILTGGAMLVASAALAHGPRGVGLEFETLDANGDGEITVAEMEAFKASRLAAVDADGDGFISFEDLKSMRQARDEERAARRFERLVDRLDTNEDGLISLEEFSQMAERRGGEGPFPRGLDANEDGVVTEEEFAEAKTNREKRGKNRRHGGHGNEGGSD